MASADYLWRDVYTCFSEHVGTPKPASQLLVGPGSAAWRILRPPWLAIALERRTAGPKRAGRGLGLKLAHATVDNHLGADDERRLRRCQVQYRGGQLFGRAETA